MVECGYRKLLCLCDAVDIQRRDVRRKVSHMESIVPQKSLIPLVSNSAIELMKIGGEVLVDSRIIARGVGLEHEMFLKTLRKYQDEIERFGVFHFQSGKPPAGSEGGRPEIYVMLNRNQMAFAITLSRNTPQVIKFKADLIEAFDIAMRPLRPCSHRPELTPAQERELIKK